MEKGRKESLWRERWREEGLWKEGLGEGLGGGRMLVSEKGKEEFGGRQEGKKRV